MTEQTSASAAQPASEPSDVVLRRFFETSETARKASSSLKKAAEVGVHFTDLPGDFRFVMTDGKPKFLSGRAQDPDFELTLAPGAVRAIASHSSLTSCRSRHRPCRRNSSPA